MGRSGSPPPRRGPKGDSEEARRLFRRGLALTEEGLLDDAATTYTRYLELDPSNDSAWFNLGLVYKQLHRWEDSLRCNLKAAELNRESDATWWNLGIAATAVRDWRTARAAWRGFGLDIPDGDGPIDLDLGLTLVRLNPDGASEVVWCRRIDPARAIIQSIPLPASGHRHGDCVLHDGEPKGERVIEGRRFLVFNELARWEASPTPTVRVSLRAESGDEVEELLEQLHAAGLIAEDWTGSIRHLCRACSESAVPCDRHQAIDGWIAQRELGLAGDPHAAEAILQRWVEAAPSRRFDDLQRLD